MRKKLKDMPHSVIEANPVEVIAGNLKSHPLCLHGPTLLFSNKKGRYFSCSLCRNKSDCSVHFTEDEWEKDAVKSRNEKYLNLIARIDKSSSLKVLEQVCMLLSHYENLHGVKIQHPTNRAYCVTCDKLYSIAPTIKHNKEHRVVSPLTDEQLQHPTSWLPTLENDTTEAQYLFSKKSIKVILDVIQKNNISNILCIGTPSVHEAAQSHPNFDSILLDYDKRHHQFYQPEKFLWYNMFNNFLFNGEDDQEILRKFIKSSSESGLCVVMDPPFGGRVEPLVHTVQELNKMYKQLCGKETDLPVVWAFPYFSEPYIQNMMPELLMHDYQVEYENHNKFQNANKKGRKFGSPVRLFTNLPLKTINLSYDKNYRVCKKCKYWVSNKNQHCYKCKRCTSKNGMTYKHCSQCEKCVKPTFSHCDTCGRCCQQKDHVCGALVESQSCYHCREKGHKKADCPALKESDARPTKKRRLA